MEDNIKNIRLKFNCPADWNAMETVDGGKFCDHCQKKVHDFTDTKQDIFLKILAENEGNVCGRYRLEQTTQQININSPTWKKWLSAAMLIVGINIFNNKVVAQDLKIKQSEANVTDNTD